jgi:hypothetical protein
MYARVYAHTTNVRPVVDDLKLSSWSLRVANEGLEVMFKVEDRVRGLARKHENSDDEENPFDIGGRAELATVPDECAQAVAEGGEVDAVEDAGEEEGDQLSLCYAELCHPCVPVVLVCVARVGGETKKNTIRLSSYWGE